jgi:hypothetical protein
MNSTANKRPLSVALICALFLIAGAVGILYHAIELKLSSAPEPNQLLVLFVRLLAIIGAIFAFRGKNWARWLLVLWMALHVVISAFNSASQTIVHAALLAVIAWFLFRRPSSNFFQARENPNP